MPETVHELEIRTTNAAGETSTRYAEVTTAADSPTGAASEILTDLIERKGAARVRAINEDR